MQRKSIPLNTARRLWSECGGYCQNPKCNRELFAEVGDDVVSLANMAHIIGHGENGPRSDHELAEAIEKDGFGNLLMLCLDCHKIVDQLVKQFDVEQMLAWKAEHKALIARQFGAERITDEAELLRRVNDLLDENRAIFDEYGPYSDNVTMGAAGDALIIWRRRCLDTILPNNQKILGLIEGNKRNFPYPWETYRHMLSYKLHADAFQDNCLSGQKVNDYKLFPLEFDHYVKTKLGIAVPALEVRQKEELEFRARQVSTFIERFLADHKNIKRMEELDKATFTVDLNDGRSLKVFVTNTYFFTEYTFDKVMAIDPEIDAIICSSPSGSYSYSVKQLCIDNNIGLFMLGEFMGALWKKDESFLNFLLRSELEDRIQALARPLLKAGLPKGLSVYAFGSFLRRKLHADIDVMIVYSDESSRDFVDKCQEILAQSVWGNPNFDFTICSATEFAGLRLKHDNLTKVYPRK